MKPQEAVQQIRETLRAGGDAEISAWACAERLDRESLRRVASLWLLEAARNAERRNVRQVEEDAVTPPVLPVRVHPSAAEIEANVRRVYADRNKDDQDRLVRRAIDIDHSSRLPNKGTDARALWELVTPRGRDWRAMEADSYSKFSSEMSGIISNFAADLKAEWTTELLSQTFTVNGRTVSWGTATVSDHEKRAEFFERAAVGNAESAARHRRALADMASAAADCLNALALTTAN